MFTLMEKDPRSRDSFDDKGIELFPISHEKIRGFARYMTIICVAIRLISTSPINGALQ